MKKTKPLIAMKIIQAHLDLANSHENWIVADGIKWFILYFVYFR